MSNKKVSIMALKPNKDLTSMSQFFEAGKLKCVIDGHHYTLENARKPCGPSKEQTIKEKL